MELKKPKLNNVLMVGAIIAIFVYIFFQFYTVTHIELETETAVVTTTYNSVNATAIVVRDEKPVSSPDGVVTVPCVEDGGKINAGGNIAMTFSEAKAATGYSKYTEIQNEINYYEKLATQTIAQTSSVDTINAEVDSKLNDYIRASSNRDEAKLKDVGNGINDSLLRRQMLIGEEVDLMKVIQGLNKELEKYSSSSVPNDYITTKESGVFSSYSDGYENIIPYDKATEATVEDIEKALDNTKNKKEVDSKIFGKLVTSYVWYFESALDVNEVKGLKDGQRVTIALKSTDEVINGEILSGANTVPGQTKTALIIKCNDMSGKLSSLRREDIEIRINAYDGIKIPATALHKKDGKTGVYALISSQVKFREAEVIYSDEDWVILKYEADNPKGVRLYDKIITQGKELQDGKIFD